MTLIERLEKAGEGSGELSAHVMMHFRAPDGKVEQSAINGAWCVYEASGRIVENSSRNGWWRPEGWKVTESLDAALALAERVLSGHRCMVERNFDGAGWAMVQRAPEYAKIMTDAATPALALCLAVLRATQETT